ncbi:MAG: NAD(P)-binding domain-containing protein [Nanoarchaeota archaeon]|nr:NAD(P)-binding domain-containing protein [Nanoarchaeota archaeon]
MKYDVVIVGAGPAGLLLGSELSREHNILVIEKDRIKDYHKPWTTEKRIVEEAGLDKFITASFEKSFIRSFDGQKFIISADLVTVNDLAILKYCRDKVIENRSKIIEKCEFQKIIKRTKNEIAIKTSTGKFSARLLIDCSGSDSMLSPEVTGRQFYCPTYGGVYNYRIKKEEICLVEAFYEGPPKTFISIYPINEHQTVVYTDQYLIENIDPLSLKELHENNIKNCYLKDELKGKKMVREVYGTIPMGDMKKHAMDNISFFGDTCLLGAPIIASGFTNIAQHYRNYASFLTEKLKKNELTEKHLEYNFSAKELMNRDLLLIIILLVINTKPEQMNKFFSIFKKIPNEYFLDALFLRMQPNQLLSLTKMLVETLGIEELAKILPKNEFMYLAKKSTKVIEELAFEELEELFHKHNVI